MRIVLDLQGAQSESRFRGIGRYSLALARAIAERAGPHEVWLALSGRFLDSIEPLRATFAHAIPPERVRVFELPGPVAEMELANAWRMEAAELMREKFLADLNPDIVHISTLFEGFQNEVVTSSGRLNRDTPTAVTLYDLIPLLNRDTYLADPARERFYLRRYQSLKRADLLLAISESSRQEAIRNLQISPDRIAKICAGVDASFKPVGISSETKMALMSKFGLERPFLLYSGGLERRKNLEGLIEAFALLPKSLIAAHQVAVTGILSEEEKRRIKTLSRKYGLSDNAIVCIGHVSDEDLRLLYNICCLFVLPSLHEGFGLPALEAMACGAPVIGSNRTSIPEVIDRTDALFDPERPQSIAERISAALSDRGLHQSLKSWGPERAKSFTWTGSARKALSAFEALLAKRKEVSLHPLQTITKRRPLTAFLSPLPPERTGIAGYSARLLPHLARHHEIVCIVDQPEVTDPWITAEFPIHTIKWFESNAGRFDRILYQFGNSPAHKHMFDLIERHPGVVMLHDFFLSSVQAWMEEVGYAPNSFIKALYESHGFSAVKKDSSEGRQASIEAFPCSGSVFRNSMGVTVHSRHALELARAWYGDRSTALIREVPFLPFPPEPIERASARKRLGLSNDAFVVCSFGLIAPVKLADQLLEAWIASPLSEDKNCFLVFVGQNHGGKYGERLLNGIANCHAASRINVTGYCQELQYSAYLSAADAAIQLRTGSRGETSAAIFDCLSRGVPLVINAHGSAEELPGEVVIKLPDNFCTADLSAALLRLRSDVNLRRRLAESGIAYINRTHHPERVAERYAEVIEDFYDRSPNARERTLIDKIGRLTVIPMPSQADLAAVAISIAANRPPFGSSQILIDVTHLADSDLHTGIERVTRGIFTALITDTLPGYRVEPIRAYRGGYLYARRFACRCLGLDTTSLDDDPVELNNGDIFVGLDWCADVVPSLKPWFLQQRARGVQIFFVVYDLLPLLTPQFFPSGITRMTEEWIKTVSSVAHCIVCISRSVADDVYRWLSSLRPQMLQSLSIQYFHLGADFRENASTQGLPEEAGTILQKLHARPSFLMVGTVEPRKGHRQVVAAMEKLWAEGIDVNLVVVGKKGWMTELTDYLEKRITDEPALSARLFWLQGITDEMLAEVYKNSCALIAASEGEGFGLPLIEAAHYGLRIIARDLPVFREIAGNHAYYFRGEDPGSLAKALRTWLDLGDAAPRSSGIKWLTWKQSSRQLIDALLGKQRYHYWPAVANNSSAKTSTGAALDSTIP